MTNNTNKHTTGEGQEMEACRAIKQTVAPAWAILPSPLSISHCFGLFT